MSIPFAIAHAHGSPPQLPTGGHFVGGAGRINPGANSMSIVQTSPRGVVDWCTFSIASGKSVNFDNGHGATLNRVVGGDPSLILGRLNASGSIYLLNPQGIVIGSGGVVTTGGRFVAAALAADSSAFMQGRPIVLSGDGSGVVINLGRIASSGGDVLLVSRTLAANWGVIEAPSGSAELVAGEKVLLRDTSSSPQVSIEVQSPGSVVNAGTIRAAQVNLHAVDGNVYALAGKNSVIRATGTRTRGARVWLVAESGTVHVNGDVTAQDGQGAGGIVETHGENLDVNGATVRAGSWNMSASVLQMGHRATAALSRSLNAGTSIDVKTTGGNATIGANIEWKGDATLRIGSQRDVNIAQGATIRNVGGGNLTLRADTGAIDNNASVRALGTIDWSRSTGTVSALYDMGGTYARGTILSNPHWSAAPYSGLLTQVTDYQLVNSLADLRKVNLNLSGNYALGKDIDASASFKEGFAPIGPLPAVAFSGQFDGMGHAVDHLYLQGYTEQGSLPTGLFGVIAAQGVVRNIKVTNSEIFNGEEGTLAAFGLLAGMNHGLVTSSYSSGTFGIGGFGYSSGGGLIGSNYGKVERSSSSAFTGSQGPLGGLVGINFGSVEQSFATGRSAHGSHGLSGGLIGVNRGTVKQSYASGYAEDAGLVGQNDATGIVDESFAAGAVAGPNAPPFGYYGGIAVFNKGTISGSVYWDRTVTAQPSATAFNNGFAPNATNGLSTAQMSTPASFAGWDFGPSGVWSMPAGASHPVLRWETMQRQD
ncbi:two-partner secretion domain-containing protein [Caballeronia grimmiae]|uniref:two-partner secretion domain-containing protein n=1 Tax=Caballeronia grimmiae TaxID=1071679 RepID=UPI0038BC412B